jgi:vacuolar-type H+-ATPase subunit H
MGEDIFETISELQKRAEETVDCARQQARQMRAEVERKLKALADELEHTHGMKREQIERELAKRREQILREFETRMKSSLARLDKVKRDKVAPVVEHIIRAFMEYTHGE